MKTFIALVIATLVLVPSTCAYADLDIGDVISKLPVQQGVAYSLKDSEFNHVSTAVIMEKWNVGLEAGYVDNGKLLAGISYTILDMKKYVKIPIIKELFLRPGIFVAFDEIDTGDPKIDYGISFTALSVKF